MDKRTGKGRQKIEIKLSESKEARLVTFSKRKKGLFKKANEFSTRTGADNSQRDQVDVGKSNVFGAFEDHRKEAQVLDEKEKDQILRLELPEEKHWVRDLKKLYTEVERLKNNKQNKMESEAK
ncbi:hypothetical protein MTR67_015871 [Solanum verrucosum]|uniref:MADS-box domain-containing protein n=1 Tax=Solanum verrucosum TaxID=315347 RepID=A0AAF0QFU0_SOLVR|nr:hypothetical protein MTR67_015871 [Solanum verrucosum]